MLRQIRRSWREGASGGCKTSSGDAREWCRPGWGTPEETSRTRRIGITGPTPRRSRSLTTRSRRLTVSCSSSSSRSMIRRRSTAKGTTLAPVTGRRSSTSATSNGGSLKTPSRMSRRLGCGPARSSPRLRRQGPFWEAEPEHQDYLENYPNGYTCHFPRPGWVLPRRSDSMAG